MVGGDRCGPGQTGALDVLVNSAGISGFVHDRESTAYLDRIMAIHLRGCFPRSSTERPRSPIREAAPS